MRRTGPNRPIPLTPHFLPSNHFSQPEDVAFNEAKKPKTRPATSAMKNRELSYSTNIRYHLPNSSVLIFRLNHSRVFLMNITTMIDLLQALQCQ